MESTTIESVANLEPANNVLLMPGKPLHRFVQKEPRSLGIVVLIFGCAEVLMGFQMAGGSSQTSAELYVPYWQGALFVVCGVLSFYTGLHPSKKMVTVCLAMYVVSLLGIIVSIGCRISFLVHLSNYRHWHGPSVYWGYNRLLLSMEAILLISSLCVSTLLIFLSVTARLALKSTNTQVFLQRTQAAQ